MKNKVYDVRKSLYIDPGKVLSLTHIFYVRKGLNDIRMVYNITSCGLNLAFWAPYFVLPIIQHTLCVLLLGYSQCDMDVGENFELPPPPCFDIFCKSICHAHQKQAIKGRMGPGQDYSLGTLG